MQSWNVSTLTSVLRLATLVAPCWNLYVYCSAGNRSSRVPLPQSGDRRLCRSRLAAGVDRNRRAVSSVEVRQTSLLSSSQLVAVARGRLHEAHDGRQRRRHQPLADLQRDIEDYRHDACTIVAGEHHQRRPGLPSSAAQRQTDRRRHASVLLTIRCNRLIIHWVWCSPCKVQAFWGGPWRNLMDAILPQH